MGRSLLGASLQVALVEVLFCWMVHRRARALGIEAATKGASSGAGYGREFGHASAYSIVGWLQGQADRLLIGGLSGTAALGSFSFATAIARNPGDAISASTGNVLRVKISVDQGLSAFEVRQRSDQLLMRGLALGMVLVLAASTALEWTRLYQWEPNIAGGHAGGVLGYSLGVAS